MSDRKYAIGIDFGTESGRAVLVDVSDGQEVATAVHPYGDGVIDKALPGTDIELPHDFALQNPADWIEVLRVTIPAVLREGGVGAEDVITPVAEAREMAGLVGARGRLAVIPQSGHLSTLEAPEAVTAELLRWLG